MIDLNETLEKLKISHDQFIALGMLVGTDYNIGGIKGIGKKNALKIVKKYHNNFDKLFLDLKWKEYFDYDWQEVFNLFKNAKVTNEYSLKFENVDKEKIIKILVDEHDFSLERIEKQLNLLNENKQKGLREWF